MRNDTYKNKCKKEIRGREANEAAEGKRGQVRRYWRVALNMPIGIETAHTNIMVTTDMTMVSAIRSPITSLTGLSIQRTSRSYRA